MLFEPRNSDWSGNAGEPTEHGIERGEQDRSGVAGCVIEAYKREPAGVRKWVYGRGAD
jgi:hypothetical protein